MCINTIKKHFLSIVILFLTLLFLYKVRGILLPFVLGVFIAYCFKDLVNKYEKKISRQTLSMIVVIAFTLIVILVCTFAFPAMFIQLVNLTKDIIGRVEEFDLGNFYNKFNELMAIIHIEDVKELKQYFVSIGNIILKTVGGITNGFISSSFQIVNVIFMIFISPIVSFYFLRDWNKITYFITNECIPSEFKNNFIVLCDRIDNILHHYIIGQINVCLILGTFYSVLLFCIGFKYSFVVGMLAGFLTLLPYIGAFGGGIFALILGYFQFGFLASKLFSILFIFCLGQFLEGNFITPNLIGNKINVHPLWLIFALFAGGSLYGFWGILVSMPLAAIIGVIVRFYFEEKYKNIENYDIKNR